MILRPFNGFVPNYGRKGGWEGGGKREVGFFFFLFSTLNAWNVRGTKATGQLSDVRRF